MKPIKWSLILLVLCTVANAQKTVTLYSACEMGGKSSQLGPGDYTRFRTGINNDDLSSIVIPAGMKAILFEDDNFNGTSYELLQTTNCIGAGWNKRMTSIKIREVNDNGGKPIPVAPRLNYGQVGIYSECFYEGRSKVLTPGNYTRFQHGLNNDDLCSLVIPNGMTVRLFADDNFNGRAITLSRTVSCLLDENFNREMTSMQVYYTGSGPIVSNNGTNNGYNNNSGYNGNSGNNANAAAVVIYEDCNYQGRNQSLVAGDYLSSQITLGPNAISSIRVAPGFGIKVYRQNNYQGNNTDFTSDQNCLGSLFNNAIQSLSIYAISGSNGNNNGYNNSGNNNGGGFNNNSTNTVTNTNQSTNSFSTRAITVYSDGRYKGVSMILSPGQYDGTKLAAGVGERSISSMVVPNGYRAKVFSGPNFDGETATISATIFNMGSGNSWNDKIGSIIVEKTY
ncbi:MAG: hypothetical protein ABIX01_03260 [Chitinophagaceae bacterium]